jgi:CrcB protein
VGTVDSPRPIHLHWRYLGLVAAGGAVGTALREALSLVIPPAGGIDLVVLGINIVGAFALGVLLERLARRGADEGRRRTARLLLGTGVLGGFTTYSTLATDASTLIAGNQAWLAIAYALGSIVLGGLAAWAGITSSVAAHRAATRGTE